VSELEFLTLDEVLDKTGLADFFRSLADKPE
jgi:hypothetical protein